MEVGDKMRADSDQSPNNYNKDETTLTMLKIYHERSNQLSNMLIAINGFILAFISGLLAFIGSSAFSISDCKNVSFVSLIKSGCLNPWPIFIAINIAIVVLILWRFYSHYIDDDIIQMYGKILSCEKTVDIIFDASLLKNLIILFRVGFIDEFPKFRQDKKVQEIKRLEILNRIEKDDVPDRGHRGLDCLAYFICSVLCILEFALIKTSTSDYFVIGILTLILISIAFFVLFSKFRKLVFIREIVSYDSIICFLAVTIFLLVLLIGIFINR
jgi:hypothetical protein